MWQSRCPNLYPIFSAFHSSGVKPVLYNRMRRGRRRRSGCWLTLFSTLRCRSRSLPRRWPRFGLARLGKVAQCIIGVVKICTYEIVKNMNYTSHMFDKKVAWISCMFEIYRVNPHCAGGVEALRVPQLHLQWDKAISGAKISHGFCQTTPGLPSSPSTDAIAYLRRFFLAKLNEMHRKAGRQSWQTCIFSFCSFCITFIDSISFFLWIVIDSLGYLVITCITLSWLTNTLASLPRAELGYEGRECQNCNIRTSNHQMSTQIVLSSDL